jgi:hypothetical protein
VGRTPESRPLVPLDRANVLGEVGLKRDFSTSNGHKSQNLSYDYLNSSHSSEATKKLKVDPRPGRTPLVEGFVKKYESYTQSCQDKGRERLSLWEMEGSSLFVLFSFLF